eukprot:scaffold9383_cov33-Attheya_sp.AAC.1
MSNTTGCGQLDTGSDYVVVSSAKTHQFSNTTEKRNKMTENSSHHRKSKAHSNSDGILPSNIIACNAGIMKKVESIDIIIWKRREESGNKASVTNIVTLFFWVWIAAQRNA